MAESINTRIANAILRHELFLVRLENGAIKRLLRSLIKTEKDILAIVNTNMPGVPSGTDQLQALTSFQLERLNNISIQIEQTFEAARIPLTTSLRNELEQFANAEGEMLISIINRQIPVSTGVALKFDTLQLFDIERMINTPLGGETFADRLIRNYGDAASRIKASLTNSLTLGETIKQATDKVKDIIGDTLTNRAEVLVRTEFARVANQVNLAAMRQNADVLNGFIWLSSLDLKVCPICRRLHGKKLPLDTNLNPPAHPQCLLGDSLISAGGKITAASKRWFDGNIIIIHTARGYKIRCTPNHPIGTNRGWFAANLLNKGDSVFTVGSSEIKGLVDRQKYNMPTRIEDIAGSFSSSGEMMAMPVKVAPQDFHGDGEGSKVGIIWANGLLMRKYQTSFFQNLINLSVQIRNMNLIFFYRKGMIDFAFNSFRFSNSSFMSGSNLSLSLHRSHFSPFDFLGLSLSAGRDAILEQPQSNNIATDSKLFSDSVFRDSLGVKIDYVVDIETDTFHGYVYNLQTENGFYVADNIITHNCRCVLSPVVKGYKDLGLTDADIPDDLKHLFDDEPPVIPLDFDEFLRSQSASFQKQALGKARYDLFTQGVSVKDMASDTRILNLDQIRQISAS